MNALEKNPARTWATIQRLRDRWVADHSRIAKGGENALAGFDYQFLLALREAVERWLADPNRRSDPQVFTEVLSDIIAASPSGPVYVMQVKRTQSGASVRAALDDLWSIHQFVRTFEPELADLIEYRIVSSRSVVVDVSTVITQWSRRSSDDEIALQDFKDRLRVEIDADPEGNLLFLLANHCLADEPLPVVHRWLGRLLHAASTSGGFLAAGREIWSELTGLSATGERNRERRTIYVWQERDKPPDDVSPGSYLTGERPTPRHLRLGFFARRETILQPLIERLLAWLNPHPASADDSLRVPVFWIGGRSGTGKSVGLLHALAAIRKEQIGPVLWLGPHLSALGEAIRWGQTLRRPGEIVVVGLDDPYAPGVQNEAVALWKQAVSELITLRQADDPTNLPVLLCCGPTEQAERLERELPDDVFLVRYDLPLENTTDRSGLREWFRHRTGKAAPETGDGDVLLVQLFFEWRVGATLPEFANRLRLRIEAADRDAVGGLTTQFSRVLALNRLYVGFPTKAIEAALTPVQKSVFVLLQRENHLVTDADDERPGLWLAHPHLSNAIYSAWHSAPADEPIRADHLRQGVLAAIEYGDNPAQQQSPLWAISRGLDGTVGDTNVADRLTDIDLKALLQDIYQALFVRYGGRLPQTHLPFWIEIQSQRADLDLRPDPVEEGITALRAANTRAGLRLTAHKLLQWLPKQPQHVRSSIVEAITGLLERTTQWQEWVPIALDALRRCPGLELGSVVARWAESHANHAMVPIVLSAALKQPRNEEINHTVARLLANGGEGSAWGDVALRVLDVNKDAVPDEVAMWVERHCTTFGVCWALGRLLTLRYGPAVAWASDWARRFHLERAANWVLEPLVTSQNRPADVQEWVEAWLHADHPNAGRLIQLLLRQNLGRTAVRDFAMDWLARRLSDPGWTFAWEGLWELHEGDAQLRSLAVRWLETTPPEHGSWAFVWEALDKVAPGDVQLRSLAMRWLETTPAEHGSWGFVWHALDKAAPSDAQLRSLAVHWLETTPPEHGSWGYVWQALYKITPSDAQLRSLAMRWLETTPPEHGSWGFVWEALDKLTPSDAQLRSLAMHWLSTTPPEHRSWRFVWQALGKVTAGDAELRSLAMRWLETMPAERGAWYSVWQALDTVAPGDAQLRSFAVRWLETTPPEHGAWGYVWRALDKVTPGDAQLRSLAMYWLDTAPPEHGAWGYVWQALDKVTTGDAQLRSLAVRWLETAPPQHASWGYVWLALDKVTPSDAQLRSLAMRWLEITPPEHGSWAFVWLALEKVTTDDAQLRLLAMNWLETTPPEHGSWQYVWQALDKITPGDAQLRSLAMWWLDTTPPQHGSWHYVWAALQTVTPGDARLHESALRWLERAPQHKSWSFVWTALWNRTPHDERLVELGHRFLQQTPERHPGRKAIESTLNTRRTAVYRTDDMPVHWIQEWENGGDRAALVSAGLQWLRTCRSHLLWASVFIRLWKAGEQTESMQTLGAHWVEEFPDGRRAEDVRKLVARASS